MKHSGSLRRRLRRITPYAACVCTLFTVLPVRGAEQVSLRNGFDFLCDHRLTSGGRTRLFATADPDNFVEVATADITSIEQVTLPPAPDTAAFKPAATASAAKPSSTAPLTTAELHELLAIAGTTRNLDVDLLAAVVHAESGGHSRAVSPAGARGLMQLMPRTALELGVTDSFEPGQNINGGTTYLNGLLIRYHDDLALALAAYNAGPQAVDKYHGVPPYRETRAYVARIIREFNQRKAAAEKVARPPENASYKLLLTAPSHTAQTE